MKIAIIGTGYVGLVSGACYAITGNDVHCVDIDQAKVDRLRRGESPLAEPGLDELIEQGGAQGTLCFTTEHALAVRGADLVMMCVGASQDPAGSADLRRLLQAAESIAPHLGEALVVMKSTSPVGANARLAERLQQLCGRKIEVATNPEFFRAGSAVDDCLSPDRVVIGARSPEAVAQMRKLHAPFVRSQTPFLLVTPESAELIKFAAIGMLATRVSFMNEMANLCELIGANIDHVREGIGCDNRLGVGYLKAGVGYGGVGFTSGVRGLLAQARELKYEPRLLAAAEQVNEHQKSALTRKIAGHFGADLSGLRFAMWGLAFKPGVDDIRESPAIPLLNWLLENGAAACVHDPKTLGRARADFGERLEYGADHWAALRNADALIVMTEWPEYCGVDPGMLRWKMNKPIVFDGRNCLDCESLKWGAFKYYGVGRGETSLPANSGKRKPVYTGQEKTAASAPAKLALAAVG